MTAGRRMAVFDLDGTLLRSDGTFHPEDLAALGALGEVGAVRVVATGRSPFSYRRLLSGRPLPIEYLVFSSGAGVYAEPEGRLLRTSELLPREVVRIASVLEAATLDYMIHEPIPESHRFAWKRFGEGADDFHRRIRLYPGHCRPLEDAGRRFGPAAHVIAIAAAEDAPDRLAEVRAALPEHAVIRSTSPIDHASVWIEIFPAGVSKGRTVAWLAEREGVRQQDVLAVGNDTNDLDLLRFAGTSFVVANAPANFREEFSTVASFEDAGVAEAVRRWL